MSTILPHMMWPLCEFRIWILGLKRAARGLLKYGTQKFAQTFAICAPSHNFVGLYLCHYSTYRQSEKNLLNSNISSRIQVFSKMANFDPLTAEIGLPVWGTPANFNRFRVLALLLQRCRSIDRGQLSFARFLAVSWAGTLYIHFGGFCPLTEFCHVQNSLCVLVLRFRILAALLHGTQQRVSAKLCGVVQGMELRNFRRRRHLYSSGRPSRWASAHILVVLVFLTTLYGRPVE